MTCLLAKKLHLLQRSEEVFADSAVAVRPPQRAHHSHSPCYHTRIWLSRPNELKVNIFKNVLTGKFPPSATFAVFFHFAMRVSLTRVSKEFDWFKSRAKDCVMKPEKFCRKPVR